MATLSSLSSRRAALVPVVLVVFCFPFWGFGENVTNPLIHAFSRVMMISHFEGSLIQFAFYGGYFAMALPAALFIRRYSYKAGILFGLILYAAGSLLFVPASLGTSFAPFLAAYFILSCGLSFLETSANPYVLSMGSPETATRRLNLAQSFGPIGSLLGMAASRKLILERLNPATAAERSRLPAPAFRALLRSDLRLMRSPYILLAAAIALLFVTIALVPFPAHRDSGDGGGFLATTRRLLRIPRYREGIVAQFFYVGAQIMVWTFVIHYATQELGMSEARAEAYNMAAMVIFVASRFLCTYLLKFVAVRKLLTTLAIAGGACTLGAILLPGLPGLYSLVAISCCMSLMFPSIYGIALAGLGEDAKIGAAGLIMAILGGSVLPPVMGAIIDQGTVFHFSAVRLSFALPLLCFVVIAVYGFRSMAYERG